MLLGVAVAGAYLLLSRLRVRVAETFAVGVITLLALLLTPAGFRTVPYYLGVLRERGGPTWERSVARPSVTNPFDVLMVLAGAVLVVAALRRRQSLWEYVGVLLGLAVGTVTAARHGVWLLMAAAAPAAVALTRRSSAVPARVPIRAVAATLAATVVLACVLVLPEVTVPPADPDLVDRVVAKSGDRVVLAPEPLAESLAVEGLTVWAVDPIDAFSPPDQVAFMDFLDGGDAAVRAVNSSDVVVVKDNSEAAELMDSMDGFDAKSLTDGWALYVRQGT